MQLVWTFPTQGMGWLSTSLCYTRHVCRVCLSPVTDPHIGHCAAMLFVTLLDNKTKEVKATAFYYREMMIMTRMGGHVYISLLPHHRKH